MAEFTGQRVKLKVVQSVSSKDDVFEFIVERNRERKAMAEKAATTSDANFESLDLTLAEKLDRRENDHVRKPFAEQGER